MNNIKILYYDRNGVSEGIDVNMTTPQKSSIFVTVSIF